MQGLLENELNSVGGVGEPSWHVTSLDSIWPTYSCCCWYFTRLFKSLLEYLHQQDLYAVTEGPQQRGWVGGWGESLPAQPLQATPTSL